MIYGLASLLSSCYKQSILTLKILINFTVMLNLVFMFYVVLSFNTFLRINMLYIFIVKVILLYLLCKIQIYIKSYFCYEYLILYCRIMYISAELTLHPSPLPTTLISFLWFYIRT